ncbi:MAG TPA: beta-galactosidase trimerization domain-containing protein, partial [Paraburkholderia sp.]
KTRDLRIPAHLPPGPLAALLPMRVWRVESLRPNAGERVNVDAKTAGDARHWRDLIDTGNGTALEICARFADGHPAYVRRGAAHYFASIFDERLTEQLFARIAAEAGLQPHALGDSLRVSRRGALTYVFNYGERAHHIDNVDAGNFVIGAREVEPQGVAAYRTR